MHFFIYAEIICFPECFQMFGIQKIVYPGPAWSSIMGSMNGHSLCSSIYFGSVYHGICSEIPPLIDLVEPRCSSRIHAKHDGIFMKICLNFSKYRRHSSKKHHRFHFYRSLRALFNQIFEQQKTWQERRLVPKTRPYYWCLFYDGRKAPPLPLLTELHILQKFRLNFSFLWENQVFLGKIRPTLCCPFSWV